MLRPAHTVSVAVLLAVTAGGTFAASALTNVSTPANVRMTAQRVDASTLSQVPPEVREMQTMVDLINAERARRGLSVLVWQDQVAAAARAHSLDMAEHRTMQHPGTDGSSAGDRLQREGFTWSAWGETIGAGFQVAQTLYEAWMNSPGHRDVLMGDFRFVGVSRVDAADGTPYWTLVAASGG